MNQSNDKSRNSRNNIPNAVKLYLFTRIKDLVEITIKKLCELNNLVNLVPFKIFGCFEQMIFLAY